MSEYGPTWSQAVGRMAAVGFASVRGRMVSQVPDSEQAWVEVWFWHVPPDRWRIEDDRGLRDLDDGQQRLIRDGDGRIQRLPHTGLHWTQGHPVELLGRANAGHHPFGDPNDFSTPTAGPVEVKVAGRQAWEFTVAPPPHKPSPLRLACDDETGAVVRMTSPVTGARLEMVDFHPNVDIAAERFPWTGTVRTDWAEQIQQEFRGEQWLRQHRPPVPRWWPGGVNHVPLYADPDTGAFTIELEVPGSPTLARTPRDGAVPDWCGRDNGRHIHQWSDETWDWALAANEPLAEDELATFVDSLTQ